MLIRRQREILSSEITPLDLFLRRRELLAAAALGIGAGLGACMPKEKSEAQADTRGERLEGVRPGPAHFSTDEPQTDYESVTTHNNFYEFGTSKTDPAERAGTLQPRPWSVAIEGEVAKPGSRSFEDLIRPHPLEERIYRLRCVEAWSMVIPWVGFPLGALLERLAPTSRAKYVVFETLHDPERMPGQRRSVLRWPYTEALRIDEAMHPLTLLAVGMYGEVLPNQNGAPLRLVVPWKYGFKSIKSIVRIRLQERRPRTTWNLSAPQEYGFYANVNPAVDHPRWTQKRERRIGEWRKRDTLFLNGYAEQVGSLYAGLDLRKNF